MEVMMSTRYGDAYVAWKMNRIMLRFRPIAPKPASAGTFPAGGAVERERRGRGKRRSKSTTTVLGGKETKRGRRTKKAVKDEEEEENNSSVVVTLPLMPVTPERKEQTPPKPSQTPSPTASVDGHVPVPYFGNNIYPTTVVAVVAPRPVGSWVTVEAVTDTWRAGEPAGLESGGEGVIKRGLERDTCPGFISDELYRVTWTNPAYRKMVEEEEEVRVELVTKAMVPAWATCFTCRVRVRYACRRRGRVLSMAVPCDVLRVGERKLAWRLDVAAALSLGLGS